METWKDIKGYEGMYQISDLGRVYSIRSKKVIKPHYNNSGYLKIDLFKGGEGKRFFVHRLVAEAYLPNPDSYPQVNHKDENKINNCVSNLEYCDPKYNSRYGTKCDRAAEKVKKAVFCIELNRFFKSITEASEATGICIQCISSCCLGKNKTAGGYVWRYA